MSVPGPRLSGSGAGGDGRERGRASAPRRLSLLPSPEPPREGPRPSLAFPLDPSWHFRGIPKDTLRFRGKGTAGAGALFAGITRKVFGQFGDSARLHRAAGGRGASTIKSHKIALHPCLGRVGRCDAP